MHPQMEKKQPERKCIGCGEKKSKQEFIRVVRTPEGSVILDTTGKASGRGAYLCPSVKCFGKVRKAKRLEYTLNCQVTEETYQTIEEEIKGLCQ